MSSSARIILPVYQPPLRAAYDDPCRHNFDFTRRAGQDPIFETRKGFNFTPTLVGSKLDGNCCQEVKSGPLLATGERARVIAQVVGTTHLAPPSLAGFQQPSGSALVSFPRFLGGVPDSVRGSEPGRGGLGALDRENRHSYPHG